MNRRDMLKTTGAFAVTATTLPFLKSAHAQSASTVVVMIGNTINSLDIHRPGTNRPSYQVAVNVYDRLVTFGIKKLADGRIYTGDQAKAAGLVDDLGYLEDAIELAKKKAKLPKPKLQNGKLKAKQPKTRKLILIKKMKLL